MARRTRRAGQDRGRVSPPLSQLPAAAPRSSFLPRELEEALSGQDGRRSLYTLTAGAAVHPRPRYVQGVYNPPSYRPAKPFAGTRFGNPPSLFAGLEVDRRALLCVKRKERREVLFARRRVGFSGSSPGRKSKFTGMFYRRTQDSRYGCR